MISDVRSELMPVLTASGSAMTVDNWTAIGVKSAVLYLSSLLMKPGIDVLSCCDNLHTYVGWSGYLVLNASDLLKNKSGFFVVRSVYDGRVSHYTDKALILLINSLKPDAVILPPALSSDALALLSDAINLSVDTSESDKPAKDALNGLVYDKHAIFSITAEDMAMSFEPLSKDCGCPPCALGLTRAYFHHLYVHTPLLCYRFLIQHNHYAGTLG